MTDTQKIIKYFAIAMAFLLIVGIFGAIIGTFNFFSGFFDTKDDIIMESFQTYNCKNDINSFDIETSAVDVSILQGETLKITTNDNYVTIKEDGNKLIINEENHSLKKGKEIPKLNIYIPSNTSIDDFNIKSGAGKVKVESLNFNNGSLELGAGLLDIDYIAASNSMTIMGGAGKINISNGSIKNLDLESGVGETTITSALFGEAKVESGIGSVTLNVLGHKDDYSMNVEKGLGSVKIDKKRITDDYTYIGGINSLSVESAIGEVNINFK